MNRDEPPPDPGHAGTDGRWRWTDDPAFDALEDAYATYQEAWGAWMVAHHRGEPVDPSAGSEADLATRLVEARTRVGDLISEREPRALSPADADALANIRASLPDLDGWPDPLVGLEFADAEPSQPAEDPDIALLRRETYDTWGAAMAGLEVDGERLDRLTLLSRLGREEDPAARRRLFIAMAPGWAVLDGDAGPDDPNGPYRRLIRSSAVRWRRSGSPIDANAAALGIDPSTVQSTFRRILATYRRIALGDRLVEPWDYRYETAGLDRRLDPMIPVERLRAINDRHLASIGADPPSLGIVYDIEPRPDRPVIPTAFTAGYDIARRGAVGWRAATPWIFATYAEGGLGNLEELLHESGHGLHVAATRARPALFSAPDDQAAYVEAIADIVGWTTHEPAFLAEHLGVEVAIRDSVIARYRTVAFDAAWTLFEMELHRHPDRPPSEVWAEIAERDLGVVGHPEWSWWAVRGQLISDAGYLANYPLGAVMVAAVRARIRELRGDWSTGDPGWFSFVAEGLLRFGGSRTPRDILRDFLGGPLTANALFDDLERAG